MLTVDSKIYIIWAHIIILGSFTPLFHIWHLFMPHIWLVKVYLGPPCQGLYWTPWCWDDSTLNSLWSKKRRQNYKTLIYLRPQLRFARLHKADLFWVVYFAMMKMGGDNIPSAVLHFGVVFPESVEDAEIYIWKQWLRPLFPNDINHVSIFFPSPLKYQKIFIQRMVHSYLVYNCGATAFCISGTNTLSFWVYKLTKPACLSWIITKI